MNLLVYFSVCISNKPSETFSILQLSTAPKCRQYWLRSFSAALWLHSCLLHGTDALTIANVTLAMNAGPKQKNGLL